MKAIDVRKGEWRALLMSALVFFCILTAYYIIRPVRDQLSGAVGSISLPLFYSATFLAMLALTPVFGMLVSRFPRRKLMLWSYSFFIVCLIAFVPAFVYQQQIGARVLGTVFFVWVSVFNLFVVSLFWSLMADIWSSRQARRLFPLIGLGGTVGALAGPTLTSLLVGITGDAPLLVISAFLITLALGILLWLAVSMDAGREPAPAIGGSLLAGARQVFTQPFLRYMALLMLLSDGAGTFAYALMADYVKGHLHTAVARTAFYGHLDLAANLLVIALQAGPTRWLMSRVGPGACLVFVAGVNLLLFGSLAVFGDMTVYLPWVQGEPLDVAMAAVPLLALVMVANRGFLYGMVAPAGNALYTRAAREARYKGKNFVETVIWRFGDLVITSGLSALKAAGTTLGTLAAISASLALGMGWIGSRVESSAGLRPEKAEDST
jgi:ATP:ADP antiporter, AAA family